MTFFVIIKELYFFKLRFLLRTFYVMRINDNDNWSGRGMSGDSIDVSLSIVDNNWTISIQLRDTIKFQQFHTSYFHSTRIIWTDWKRWSAYTIQTRLLLHRWNSKKYTMGETPDENWTGLYAMIIDKKINGEKGRENFHSW